MTLPKGSKVSVTFEAVVTGEVGDETFWDQSIVLPGSRMLVTPGKAKVQIVDSAHRNGMDLPNYQDGLSRCEKCGAYEEHEVEYRSAPPCIPGRHGASISVLAGGPIRDHLHRTCRRCRFQWDEAVV